MMAYKHSELTEQIIRAFYKVYNTLGYGFLEKVYLNAMYIELTAMGLRAEKEKRILVYYFGNIVGEKGDVYSYEIREDFSEIAKRNVEKFGLTNVHIKCKDVAEGIEEDDVDIVFLDLPKPWDVVESAKESLKVGGFIATYTPYIEQVQILHRVLKKFDFSNLNTVECILREIEVKNKGTRPKTRGAGHTGYLTFARNL